jgi:hypothetical protein
MRKGFGWDACRYSDPWRLRKRRPDRFGWDARRYSDPWRVRKRRPYRRRPESAVNDHSTAAKGASGRGLDRRRNQPSCENSEETGGDPNGHRVHSCPPRHARNLFRPIRRFQGCPVEIMARVPDAQQHEWTGCIDQIDLAA